MKRSAALILMATLLTMSPVLMSFSSASTPSQGKLNSQLLSLRQMPAGWTTHSPSTANEAGCLKNLLEPRGVTQTRSAEVLFVAKGDLPILDEKLATYSNANRAYAKIIAAINACKVVNGLSPSGHRVTGSVTKVAWTHYGNASSAYVMTLSSLGVTLHYDYLIVRKNQTIVGILEANAFSVNTSQFRSFVVKALAKVK